MSLVTRIASWHQGDVPIVLTPKRWWRLKYWRAAKNLAILIKYEWLHSNGVLASYVIDDIARLLNQCGLASPSISPEKETIH